jgi:hypothetical protein
MNRSAMIVVLLLGVAPAGALAQSDPGTDQPQRPECTCRAAGRVFRMGETICLRTPAGDRVAVCEMVINVTSWRPTAKACDAEATQ